MLKGTLCICSTRLDKYGTRVATETMSSRLNYLLFKCLSISLVICTHSTLSHKHTHTQVRLGNNLSIHCPTAVSVIVFVTIACSLYICLPVVSVCTAQLSGDSVSRTVCGPRGMPATAAVCSANQNKTLWLQNAYTRSDATQSTGVYQRTVAAKQHSRPGPAVGSK